MAARKASPFQITLTFVKETKGTVVYRTDDENAAVNTVYVSKAALGEDNIPTEVRLSLQASTAQVETATV